MPVSEATPVRRELFGSLQNWFKEEPVLAANCPSAPSTADPPCAKGNHVNHGTPIKPTSSMQPSPVGDFPPDANHQDPFIPTHLQHHQCILRNASSPTHPDLPPAPTAKAESQVQHTITDNHLSRQTCPPTTTQPPLRFESQPREQLPQQSVHAKPTNRFTYSIDRLNELRHHNKKPFPNLTSQHAAILQSTEPPSATPAETFPNLTFADMHLPPSILHALTDLNFHKPSPIQQCAIPRGRLGTDIIAHAKSGTGKTLAFTIITLETLLALKFTAKAVTSVLILVPTRELVDQVASVFRALTRFMETKPRVQTLKGGRAESIDAQELSLSPAHIIIGTPGRVIALIKKSILVVDHVNLFVMDEADRLVDSTYLHSVPEICALLPSRRQTLAFSATYEPWLRDVLMEVMRDPAFFSFPNYEHLSDETDMLRRAVLNHVHQYKVEAVGGINDKLRGVGNLLKSTPFHLCIAFINEKKYVAKVVMHLKSLGYSTQILNASLEQHQRERAISDIMGGKAQIVVATDLLARGVDFEACDLVIQLDVPYNPATYLHRIGRAGRYGKSGSSFLFYNLSSDLGQVEALETSLGSPIEEYRHSTDKSPAKGNQHAEGRASGCRVSVVHSNPSTEDANTPQSRTNVQDREPVNRDPGTPARELATSWRQQAHRRGTQYGEVEAAVGDELGDDSPLFRSHSHVTQGEGQHGISDGRGGKSHSADGHQGPPQGAGKHASRPGGRGSAYDSLGAKSIPPHKSPLKKRKSLPRKGVNRGGRKRVSFSGVTGDLKQCERRLPAVHTRNDEAQNPQRAVMSSGDATRPQRRLSDPTTAKDVDVTQHATAPVCRDDLGSESQKLSLHCCEGKEGHATPRMPPDDSRSLARRDTPDDKSVSVIGNDSREENERAQTGPQVVKVVVERAADQPRSAGVTRREEAEAGQDSHTERLPTNQNEVQKEVLPHTDWVLSKNRMSRGEETNSATRHDNARDESRSAKQGGASNADMWDAYAKDAYAVGYREAYREAFRMAREVAERTRATTP